jgi:ankyrin repeat protein
VNFTVIEDGAAETALTVAAKYNATEALQALLAAGADASREANYVALCYGANSNNFAVVRFMLAAGAPVDYEAGASLVPLARAVMQRHTQMVHYLIEQGADVNRAFPVCCEDTQNASVALEQASLRSSVWSCTDSAIVARPVSTAVLQVLLDAGADVRYTNSEGVTALQCLLALPAAPVEAIELLAQRGAELNACDYLGYTPLLFALAEHCEAAPPLQQLRALIAAGANCSYANALCITPLGVASSMQCGSAAVRQCCSD